MAPVSLHAKTREQAAYEALRQAVVEGRWGQGEPLVGSRVADEIGVSRITVANALKRLAGEGFVHLVPHKGAVVARLEPTEVREIYLMRAELEALAAQEAARRIRPDDLSALDAANHEIGRLGALRADIGMLRAADRAFHRQVHAIAGMPFLAETLRNLADQCEGYRARLLDQRPIFVPAPARHAPILNALAARDPAAAETAREHVLNGMRAVLANLDDDQSAARSA